MMNYTRDEVQRATRLWLVSNLYAPTAGSTHGRLRMPRVAPMIGGMDRDVHPGQLREYRLLAGRSLYRVVAVDGRTVLVEVVHVPGLAKGQQVRLTRTAVERMTLVESGPGVEAGPREPLH